MFYEKFCRSILHIILKIIILKNWNAQIRQMSCIYFYVCHFYLAIHNFAHPIPHAICLMVGEVVQITAECADWYYGRSKLKGTCGIFPKSYIHILQKSTNTDNLVQEITSVLREWGHQWKHLYVVCIKCSLDSSHLFLKREKIYI